MKAFLENILNSSLPDISILFFYPAFTAGANGGGEIQAVRSESATAEVL